MTMNRRQVINKILHTHIDVNSYEDYTDYKKLITAIEEWHESEIEKNKSGKLLPDLFTFSVNAFNGIADSCRNINSGNASHKAKTLEGTARRNAEFIIKHYSNEDKNI